MVEIYRAGPQLGTVRKFILFSLVCAVAAIWWGWHLFNSYGLSPGDGGSP